MPHLTFLKSIPMPHLGEDVCCKVYESKRARRSWVRICSEDGLRVIIPSRMRQKDQAVRHLLESSLDWIRHHWTKAQQRKKDYVEIPGKLVYAGREYEGSGLMDYAKIIIGERTCELAALHSFSFNRISVRRKKSNWGSCTRRRTLSFNWQIAFLAPELRDYVIVHELAHLRQFNHSKYFWAEVEKLCPDFRALNRQLRGYVCS